MLNVKGKCLYKAPPQTAPPTTDPGSVDKAVWKAVAIKRCCLVEFHDRWFSLSGV